MKIKLPSRKKEIFYLSLMILVSALTYIAALFSLTVIIPLYGWSLLSLLFQLPGTIFFVGNLQGNAIQVTSTQFGDIYEILKRQSKQLGLKRIPEMYILEGGGILYAFAARFLGKNYVTVYSDVLSAAYQEDISIVEFIIGHELGHIKYKHTRSWHFLLMPARFIIPLNFAYSRACEYTSDNVGYYLAPNGAEKGILLLAAGKNLWKKVNIVDLLHTQNKKRFPMILTEIISTHPMLVKRLSHINELKQKNIIPSQKINSAGSALFTPLKENGSEWDPLKKKSPESPYNQK